MLSRRGYYTTEGKIAQCVIEIRETLRLLIS